MAIRLQRLPENSKILLVY